MLSGNLALFRYSFAARVMALAGVFITAHASAALSSISAITLYPGGATVERQIELPAGNASIEITCLPASFDPQSLRLSAPPNVQLGDFHLEDVAAAQGNGPSNEGCATTGNDKHIRALQAQLAELNARAQAIELSAQYLQNVSQQGAGSEPSASTVHALEQNGYAVYAQRAQIKQQQDETQNRLNALRDAAEGPSATRTLQVAFDAPHGGLLTIAYDTRRAGWIPAYQANFDSARGRVTLERRALVAQATGEDWRGVKLQLSTGTPGNVVAPQPDAWRLRSVDPGLTGASKVTLYGSLDDGIRSVHRGSEDSTSAPLFEPTQIEGAFLTKFEVPGKIDVPSDAQKVGFTLGQQSLPARLVARVIPDQSTSAWLIATADRPAGVWPDGNVQLRRDNAQVGEINLSQALRGSELSLPFGSDEQVFVSSTDGANASGTVRTSGNDASRTISRRYTVKNRHRMPLNVEIVESTPVSDSADIKVTSAFTPQPDDTNWQGHQGIVAWKRTLAAGGEVSVGASYRIRYPDNRTIVGLP